MTREKIKIWVITDGRAGNVRQAQGLYQAIARYYGANGKKVVGREYTVEFKDSFMRLPARLWPTKTTWFIRKAIKSIEPENDLFHRAPADIIIGAGRRSAPIVAALKRRSPFVFVVQLMDPKMDLRKFDLVVTPQHDKTTGLNVIQTQGALHTITQEMLSQAYQEGQSRFGQLPEPRVGVLLGGKSQSANFNLKSIDNLGQRLQKLHREAGGGSILVAPSRRTQPEMLQKLKSHLADIPHYIWNGDYENPYTAILAVSDVLVVTEDSVNMATEASATGKPVYIAPAEKCSEKIKTFHRGLYDLAVTRPFRGNWEQWRSNPLFEAENVAKAVVMKHMAQKRLQASLGKV